MVKAALHEKILLDGLKEGDMKIFDYLFHYYYSGLVVFSFSYIEDMDAAEDLVQDFFFHLWLNHEKLDIHQSIKSYFFTAIRNKSHNFIKRRKIEHRIEKELTYLHSKEVDEKNLLVESELSERINEALDKLPEKCRKIFLMNRFEGMKPAEIAKQENISIRTVEGHIGKAVRMLRTELKPYLPALLIMMLIKGMDM
jgi:RNA polymerase sigma-70 factor (ECF subfamily)